jgi:hypothetical protein
MTSGMMIGRVNGRDQFGAGRGEGSSRKRYATTADVIIPWVESSSPAVFRAVTTRPQPCVGAVPERAIKPKPALVTLTLVPNRNAARRVLQ